MTVSQFLNSMTHFANNLFNLRKGRPNCAT